ncbi:sulfotransferase family 2 domain-containing protein [Synechococcus sp. CC9616]|uniref:sulfotransferase family 2 domain-containing protein n=1 Tax=Synechococcus sp. CC9616 TaxID=110663 RepID=UPI0012ECA90E|nr:sulfotransferase family 2 domain-containing protein [Synechococcus sp. CC9616]
MKRKLQFVHIGKCGGSTLKTALYRSTVIAEKYSSFFESHINGVVVDPSCDYFFCVRNPIERAFSAFEWRKKLVLEDLASHQIDRFPGEAKILSKYKSLGNIARSLYRPNNRLDQAVARDFRSVHHLRESISFYCQPLFGVLTPSNLFGVVCQETLVEDCSRILGIDASGMRERSNLSKRRIDQDLDAKALGNLKRFLVEDYQCLAVLWSLGALSDQQFWHVMTSSADKQASI